MFAPRSFTSPRAGADIGRMPRPLSFRLCRFTLSIVALAAGASAAESTPRLEWSDVPAILARIRAPEFPDRRFDIASFGAKADDQTDSLPAIQAAIERCHAAGGGHVQIPAGAFMFDGPIRLQSNVDLHLAAGAVLRFSGRAERLLPAVRTRWEGTILQNYSPLIYARGAENVAITGAGTIDGNARGGFAEWRGRQGPAQERSRQMNATGAPLAERNFGAGDFLRPPLIEPYECRRVLIEGVTLKDSPFWVIHPTFCRNIIVRGVTVDSLAINNDGCDPDSCADVLIEDCFFHTGDDGIALKAGRDADAWRDGRPTENVVVRRCRFQSRINGLCIGSEMSAGVRHVFVEDCRVETGESCLYFKSNRDRGGYIENIRVRRITVDVAKSATIRFETNYHSFRGGNAPTAYRDFALEDITCADAQNYFLFAEGVEELPMRDIRLRHVTVAHARAALFVRGVEGLRFDEVRVNGELLPEAPLATPADTPKLPMRL